jgi:5-carboxymethyl-2-hydroxymuconate isomerase
MPHIVIEHSALKNLKTEVGTLLDAVFEAAEESGLFDADDIKARAIEYAHHRNGRANYSFIHADIKIMPGRSSQQKSDLAGRVLKKLRALKFETCLTTVEVTDIASEHYVKAMG